MRNKIQRHFKLFISVQFVLFFAAAVFAHGAKDISEISVENLQSWQESFDLEGKKKGKYNIMVTATDLGGNVHIEGPHNIYVDPNSDLPVSGITNPYQDMRIVGNLNIVGTCVDDDAVQFVDLILDGDEENPVRATGKEFWSYYLDTTQLEEGIHTIKVVGTDINGLQGNPVELSWNLDRRQPITEINNHGMGDLVSGNVKFSGIVSDGNGIRSLAYSLDNGETFKDIKLKNKKEFKEFSVSVDTKKFDDGPAVLWFKAIDNAGSVGVYSFLYFIDNTPPEIKIITPEEKVAQYGKVAVAGIAKDVLGVTELTWKFGVESGSFELVPGNPYWGIVFDTIGSKDKSRKFTITGKDLVGNVVNVSREISLNQELDKPTLKITEPVSDTYFEADDEIFIRGIAKDKEGISSVFYKLDNGGFIEEQTAGVFYSKLAVGSELSTGKHTITAYAVDKNEVKGDSVSVTFNARGPIPEFTDVKISGGSTNLPFVNGISVHPEAGLSFNANVSSGIGLENIHYEMRWASDGKIQNDIQCANSTNYKLSIPLSADMPKGVVKIFITAKDSAGREKNFKALLDVVNTSIVNSAEPKLVFDDSTFENAAENLQGLENSAASQNLQDSQNGISQNGTAIVVNNSEFPASGYFIGGNARSVEIVPATNFATAELRGNQVVLIPGKAVGVSEPVVVRVTTDQGLRYDSQKIIFKNDTILPVLNVNRLSETNMIDGFGRFENGLSGSDSDGSNSLSISGTATCATGLERVFYTVYFSRAVMSGDLVNGMEPVQKQEPVELSLNRSSFSFDLNAANGFNGFGVYFIEITAVSKSGNRTSSTVCVKNIPTLGLQPNGKPYVAKAPMIVWADGENVYAAAVFQDSLSAGNSAENESAAQDFKVFKRSELSAGANALSFTVTSSKGKSVTGKYTATKIPEIKANFAYAGDKKYASGIPVEISSGSSSSVQVYVDSEGTVTAAEYEISGENVPGGSNQSGKATFAPSPDVQNRTIITIPLSNLPVRINKIKLTVHVGSYSKTIVGSVSVVRPSESSLIDDKRSVYLMESSDSYYDSERNLYVMKAGETFNFYANTPEIISAELLNPSDGISLEQNGNNVVLKAEKDGTFRWQQIRVKDANGISYTSPEAHLLVDSGAPELVISTPEIHSWLKNTLRITGTASDPSGISYGEYSIDGGENWKPLSISATRGSLGATFSNTEDISAFEDGEIKVDVRVCDAAGHFAYARTVAHKDTTPPEVELVMPNDDAVVNGDNLIGFKVYDEGKFEKAYYNAPSSAKVSNPRVDLGSENYIQTHVGTESQPLSPAMSFSFSDAAGNTTTMSSWNFKIDSDSDLPLVEIHLPTENEVITRDFTISGVVYDDDGASSIYYRIDSGEYIKLAEPSTSFAIDIPFSTMVDNEHTIYVYAVDINGVRGPVVERKFRVSTEEPKGSVTSPTIDTSVKDVITISGVASDKNGINKVFVSLDNGNSYNLANGKENWSYTFDTRAIPNGTQVVFIRIIDNYGIQGLYSSLINIDNQAPEMILDYPEDYSVTSGPIFFSGYAFDNVNITEMYVTIRSLDGKSVPRNMQKINFKLERIIANTLDFSGMENGLYNLELTALDKAGNKTHLSRNIQVDKTKPLAVVNLLYPLNGEHKRGNFNIYGEASAEKPIENVSLYIDDKFVAETSVERTGYFKFPINSEMISRGIHKYRVDAKVQGGNVIRSREQTVDYNPYGAWVTVDNFTYGNFAVNRPYISGRADYTIDEEELLASKEKTATKEQKEAIEKKKVAVIEISFDNGKTFELVSKNSSKWKYRIENEDLPEGYHFMLVRATMRNGERAIERCIIQIDSSVPSVRLIAPVQGGKYNQSLLFSGLSSDDIGLGDVKLTLRKGDKSSYEVPSFIQGLYFDFSFWGATLFNIGAGLTFFDDAVKVQFQWGQFTQAQRNIFAPSEMRYGGDNVMGVKLIANIFNLPFSYFLGRDFEWLSANFAVGANFTRFNQTASGEPQILSALLAQLEFPKINFKDWKAFSTFSFYTEFSLWFIPTDVSGGDVEIKNLIPQISEGIRINVF